TCQVLPSWYDEGYVRFLPIATKFVRQRNMSRIGWTGRAPAPQRLLECAGACQEKGDRHGPRDQVSFSDHHHRHRYGQECTSHGRARLKRRHRLAREGRAGASGRDLRICRLASLASKQEWRHTMLLVRLPRLATM